MGRQSECIVNFLFLISLCITAKLQKQTSCKPKVWSINKKKLNRKGRIRDSKLKKQRQRDYELKNLLCQEPLRNLHACLQLSTLEQQWRIHQHGTSRIRRRVRRIVHIQRQENPRLKNCCSIFTLRFELPGVGTATQTIPAWDFDKMRQKRKRNRKKQCYTSFLKLGMGD